MADGQDLMERIGRLRPAVRAAGQPLHRPLLLLWAIAQAVHGRPRQQPWSVVKHELAPLLTQFDGAQRGERDVVYPFWALQRDGLWEVADSAELPLTSGGRRPTFAILEQVNPLAGLPEADYNRLIDDSTVAADALSTLLVRFFGANSGSVVEALRLREFVRGPIGASLLPLVGEQYADRKKIAEAYGGNGVMGITPLADGILAVYSDDKGPYPDHHIPETGWIAYTGDGLSGDQTLTVGNKSMQEYQKQEKALRYWHKPYNGSWTFETWAVVIQCRRRWGRGEDKKQRREYVWVLAPVPSPLRETWPSDVVEALAQDDKSVHDDSVDVIPAEVVAGQESRKLSAQERYQQLSDAARRTDGNRTNRSKPTLVERYMRSAAAREAVIIRSEGRCENPACGGHPLERTDSGQPLLEVDHVNGLARTGQDTPEFMIALCPNCHALKTRGAGRGELQKSLVPVARKLHRAMQRGERRKARPDGT
ncbi:HNH endonuclease [Streptomyces antibioticus]|uniref:HNH endonuclease n=1 Tax=Streptomyces antibioticus TaxID=1890 RepID=UPI0033B95738